MSMNSKKRRDIKKKSQHRKRDDRINHSIAPMPPEYKKELLPYTVIKLISGAQVNGNHKLKADLVRVYWNNEEEILHIEDYNLVKIVADKIWKEHIQAKNLMSVVNTIPTAMEIHRFASRAINKIVDLKTENKKKIIFIKDQSGCGYWRMIVPARYMAENTYIDMAEIEVIYDYLLEYETIVVQRLHTWREYYTIERLKRQGKKIIYDIDDDLFNIPDDNIASRIIRIDQQNAARAIMSICDKITTTNHVLKERLGFPDKTVIIPNSIDLEDGYPEEFNESEDEFQRIVWMGSHTHERDWFECFEAIDKILKERDNVRLVLMGYFPKIIQNHINNEKNIWWNEKIEYMEFQEPETYIQATKEMTADIGIAPLENRKFNFAKSNLKWQEYSAAYIPVVASNVFPYNDDIVNGENGFLANNTTEWKDCLTQLLDNKELRMKCANSSRELIRQKYDIVKNISLWEDVIL